VRELLAAHSADLTVGHHGIEGGAGTGFKLWTVSGGEDHAELAEREELKHRGEALLHRAYTRAYKRRIKTHYLRLRLLIRYQNPVLLLLCSADQNERTVC